MTENNFRMIDIGYGYLKYLTAEGSIKKLKAVVGVLGDSLNSGEAKGIDILNVDGIDYVIGDDVYSLNKKPITANDNAGRPFQTAYKVLGLYALTKTSATDPVTVITGLPFQNMDEAADVKNVFNGNHDVKLNGKQMKINVADTKVVSQGLGSFYSLVKQRGSGILKKKILLVDLGFRTINYLPLSNGDIDANAVKTNRELGIQNAYKEIVEGINREFKANYQFHDVDELLDRGIPKQDKDKGKYYEDIKPRDYVQNAFRSYAADVWGDFLNRYGDKYREELDEVIFSGGTAERVGSYLEENKKHFCSVVENAQDVQVEGYGIISEKL